MSDFPALSIPMASAILALGNRDLGQPAAIRPFDVLLRRRVDSPREQSANQLLAPLAALAAAEPLGGGLGYFTTNMVALAPPAPPPSAAAAPTAALHRESRVRLLDVAPYARAVARHDLARDAARAREYLLSTQGSASGSDAGAKRVRLTRASRSAVEGGRREETRVRRERWWGKDVNLKSLLMTGGEWGGFAGRESRLATEDEMEM
jgi:hypothetical protein